MKFSTDRTSQQATDRTPQQTKGLDIMNTNATRTSTVERVKRGLKNIAATLFIVAAALGFSMTLVPNTSLLRAGLFHHPGSSDPCKAEKDALDKAIDAKNKAQREYDEAQAEYEMKNAAYLAQKDSWDALYLSVLTAIAGAAAAAGAGCTVVWPIVGTISCAAASAAITAIGSLGYFIIEHLKTKSAERKKNKAKDKRDKKGEKLDAKNKNLTEANRDLSDCLERNRKGWLGL